MHVAGRALVLLWLSCIAGPAMAQSSWPCPRDIPIDVVCYGDRQPNGSYILAAVPKAWTGVLIVHAHGGPRTAPAQPRTNDEDLARLSMFVREGHAWVASTYRRPGYGVRMAAADTDMARRYFLNTIAPLVGKPKHVILHGQSWGGNIAAKLLELDARRTRHGYDGGLLTSAVLPGGARTYWFRADLRAVYQYYCHNMPRPDEPQYVVATGLPRGATLTDNDLRERVEACTGISRPAAERTPQQAHALANILSVTHLQEGSLMTHMLWSTFVFHDIVHRRLGGRNPFSNVGVSYAGSSDDTALNAGVPRFASDPVGRAALDADSGLSGRIAVPVITMHATRDPTTPVENEAAYRSLVARAGKADKLVQVYVDEVSHSRLSAPQYPAILDAMLAWIETRKKPTAESISKRCEQKSATYGEPCRFDLQFTPAASSTRAPDRTP
jgi:alpha-beta hydrolase superfamily lysophospholipase